MFSFLMWARQWQKEVRNLLQTVCDLTEQEAEVSVKLRVHVHVGYVE